MVVLSEGTIVEDEVHRVRYQLEQRLGEGGFGTAYRAVTLTPRGRVRPGSETCLKFSDRADEWHAEVYFLGLLREVGHVVRLRSSFPTHVMQRTGRKVVFCIDMELVPAGSVLDLFNRGEKPWTEAQVRHRVRQLLKPLAVLHAMGASHRDITPGNVFVGGNKVLKLGDFGITKAQLGRAGVHADAFTKEYAPPDLGAWWRPADDVYQVGLLMATMLTGEDQGRELRLRDVDGFTEPGQVRDALKSALRARSKRPRTASELAERLQRPAGA